MTGSQAQFAKSFLFTTFEIGGAGKRRKQLKRISGSRFVLTQPGNLEKGIPLTACAAALSEFRARNSCFLKK